MASRIGLIRAVLNLDSAGFRQGLERAQSASERFQKKMRRMEFRMKRFGRKMENVGRSMTMGITLPIIGAAGAAVKSAADFEALGVQMEVLTGSVEEGKKAFEDLKRFSARTPFQLKDLTKAQNTLMGFGESTEKAFEHLQMLGDVAAVTGGDLQAITVAFGQASAEGKLMTRDIRQLINQGVPAIKMLSESLGVAQSEILDMASAGEITFDVLVESFRQATEEGGQFANGTEKLANTLKGVFSTLKDNVSIALAELGESIEETLNLKRIAKNVSKQLQQVVGAFQNMSQDSRRQLLKFAALFAAGGPVLWAVGKFARIIAATSKFVRSRFLVITGSFALGVSIGQWFVDNWAKFAQDWENDMRVMEITAKKMILGTMDAFKKFINFATQMAPPEFISGIFGVDLSEMAFEASGMNKIMSGLRKDITEESDKLVDGIGKLNEMEFTSFAESAKRGFSNIKDEIMAFTSWVFEDSSLQKFIEMLNKPKPDFGIGGGGSESGSRGGGSGVNIGLSQETVDTLNWATKVMNNNLYPAAQRIEKSFENLQAFGQMFGNALTRAVVQGNKLGSIMSSIGRQLASKGIMTALSFLLPGGAVVGKTGFFDTLFGGVFHDGGVVPGPIGQERLILAQGGETVLTPEQMRSGGAVTINPAPVNIFMDSQKIAEGQVRFENKINR